MLFNGCWKKQKYSSSYISPTTSLIKAVTNLIENFY